MRNFRLIMVLFGVAGLLFVGFTVLFSRNMVVAPERELMQLGEAPRIELTSQANESFDSSALAGKIWVADFFFTSCGGPCPVMTAAMSEVQQAFEADDRVHLVSITVDPDTDTPERLREYGEKYGADFEQWHFLTGPIEHIQELAVEGFKVGSVEDPVIHSTRFILVDQQGQIRGYYIGIDKEDVQRLTEDMKQLLGARRA
jgi:cytochrome oxidase Cu insertion factor (SCO1/SenC/PrrC family)